jgi:hypothetical protein
VKCARRGSSDLCLRQSSGMVIYFMISVFCNRYVCSKHMIKKREYPGVLGEFVEIYAQCI